jgi:hypothetical protein
MLIVHGFIKKATDGERFFFHHCNEECLAVIVKQKQRREVTYGS